MTYNKYTWVTGEVITKEKLNHIEDGIGDSLDVDTSNISDIGKSNLSGLGMPSNRYIDLTLGASDTEYTAPANGWITFTKQATSSQYFQFANITANWINNVNAASGQYISITCPVKKDDVFRIAYNLNGETAQFRFIYAEGDQ